MKINTKIRYGLRMLVLLAEKGEVVNTEILGKKMLVSPKYLRKLAGPMERSGLITSIQGKYGGYKLNKKPEEIFISSIFESYDESLKISGCSRESGCPLGDECVTADVWSHFEDLVKKEFFKISIKNILKHDFKH
ncbi:MAG: Rrf2 family transcriptional regulator [Acidobacteriota bacterium]